MEPFNDQASWLYGYGIGGLGGIAADAPVRVGPLSKMNFLVGRNNHGKSTLLRAAVQWTPARTRDKTSATRETLVPVARRDVVQMLRQCSVRDPDEQEKRLAGFVPLRDEWVGVWVEREKTSNVQLLVDPQELNQTLREQLGIANYSATIAGASFPHVAQRCVLIPAFRQLRPSDDRTTPPDLASGEGLVAELGTWQHPKRPASPQYTEAKQRWFRLREFIRDVLEDPEAELEIADATDLHVQLAQASSMLHTDSLGDGIKQVLMIAAACIYFDDSLILLEEPEIHLHAGLQRKLMCFLSDNTKNQYLIATHSAHVLDLPGASIFHVTHDGRSTQVAPAVRASDVQQVCVDLGYMASDLLQANYTIWVEGPSDRVYWKRWLELVAPDLIEGVHFTIMSYGGYLIDSVHLRDEPDPATSDLVHLLKLGRQCSVIADSDKLSDSDQVRPTIARLQQEALHPGSGTLIVCDWVRTVENLIPREVFRQAVIAKHPTAGRRLLTSAASTPFDAPFDRMRRGTYSKVEIAKEVAPRLTVEDIDPQLLRTLQRLASDIRSANGLIA